VATSYLRRDDADRAARRAHRRLTSAPRRRFGTGHLIAGTVLVLVAALAAIAGVFATSSASLSAAGDALAQIGMPLGGGTVKSVNIDVGPSGTPDPARVVGDPAIWPKRMIPAHDRVNVYVTIKRPGWISWLTGSTERLHLTLTAPSASLRAHYVTLRGSQPLVLHFAKPIRTIAYGTPGHLTRRVLATPRASVTIPHSGSAGTLTVNATLHTWESARNSAVSYFPAGGAATAVATPAPGSRIGAHTPITLTFSKAVSRALGTNLPPVTPATQGTWEHLNSHAIRFVPAGYGYGLGANVSIPLPSGVHLVGASASSAAVGNWSVPGGTTQRLQQLLAMLNYLPLTFTPGHEVPTTPEAQVQAAIHPPAGHFSWSYPNTPAALRAMWAPGTLGTMTKGALMAFESDHGLLADGVPGAAVWKALIAAIDQNRRSSFGYTFVMVDKASSPESERTWHNGRISVSGPVNTGVAAAPTASGIFPVFEHLPVTTMTGTNPDGSHYSDPGIQWVSYFNGGDALHAFTRAQYGFPQSDGCVEMPLSEAASVYPLTPIGTLVDVS
jgi:peptidoglycan hydrolase-like protein with peptidoglycan-binding domain